MQKRFWEFIRNGRFLKVALVAVFIPSVFWNMDARISMILCGALLALFGLAHYLDFEAERSKMADESDSFTWENRWSGCLWWIPKAASCAFIAIGLCFILSMILFFVRGEVLGSGR